MSEKCVLALTEDIYDAAMGDVPWGQVGDGLIRLLGARSISLMAGRFGSGDIELLSHQGIPGDAVTAYSGHYRSVDLWTGRAAEAAGRMRPGTAPNVWISGTLVSDSEFLRSEFYCDFGKPLGLRHVVGTVAPLGAAGVLAIGLHRPEGAGSFERRDAETLGRLLPHLCRALQLRRRLGGGLPDVPPGLAALDALSSGVLVVDPDLNVLVANAAAEAMSGRETVFQLAKRRIGGGQWTLTAQALRHADSLALGALVRATALGSSGGAVPLRDADGLTAVAALVLPLPRRLAGGTLGVSGRVQGQALLILRELRREGSAPDARRLRDIFGLTRSEAEVVCALAGGATKASVAERRNLRASTIHTQVRSILAKTGAANLRDLERILGGIGEI